MKKMILTAGIFMLLASHITGFSQTSETSHKKELRADLTPEEIAKKKTDKMTKTLELNKSQQESMYAINLKHANEQAILKAERNALKAKYKAEREAYKTSLEEILNDEQKALLAEQRAKQAERRLEKRASRPPMPPMPPEPASPSK